MEPNRTAPAEATEAQPAICRAETDSRPSGAHRDSLRAAQRVALEMGCGSGTTCWRRLVRWQRAGVWKRLHRVLLTELRQRGQIDLARAVVDSASLRALRGGKKLDRTLPIAAKPGRSIMFSLTRTGFRSSRR